MDDSQIENNKVFFITSNYSSLDDKIHYSLSRTNANAMINFNSIFKEKQKYNKKEYTINVFYFEIVPKELREKDFDIKSKKNGCPVI